MSDAVNHPDITPQRKQFLDELKDDLRLQAWTVKVSIYRKLDKGTLGAASVRTRYLRMLVRLAPGMTDEEFCVTSIHEMLHAVLDPMSQVAYRLKLLIPQHILNDNNAMLEEMESDALEPATEVLANILYTLYYKQRWEQICREHAEKAQPEPESTE
jgi:hypothetical protein